MLFPLLHFFYCFTSLVIGLDNPLHQVLPFFDCVWYLYRLSFLFSLQGRQVGEEEEKGLEETRKAGPVVPSGGTSGHSRSFWAGIDLCNNSGCTGKKKGEGKGEPWRKGRR